VPTVPTRRDLLADAAITTLARAGSRGLTHRAVDRAAGVADGSTSYYFRTRASLLTATVRRLAELDAAELPALLPGDGTRLAEAFTSVVRHVLSDGRDRQVARYELMLEATRRPELAEVLASSTAQLTFQIARRLDALGARDPQAAAGDLMTFLDGYLLAAVTSGAAGPPPHEHVRRSVDRLLRILDLER
jgi:DNA-binding transcriptional regulator YbjK